MKKDALMIAISMLIFGTVGAFKRFIPVSAGELALYRAVLASIVIGLVLLVTKKPIPFGKIKKAAAASVCIRRSHGHQLDLVV